MKTKFVFPDGSPVPQNETVETDNFVTTYSIQIRSLNCLSGWEIKQLIQRKCGLEVIHTPQVTESIAVCKPI